MVENLSFDLWSNKFILGRIKFEMFRGKVVWRFSFWESYFSSLICRKVNLKNDFVNWKNGFVNCSYRNLDLFCGVFSIENGWSYQKQAVQPVLELEK